MHKAAQCQIPAVYQKRQNLPQGVMGLLRDELIERQIWLLVPIVVVACRGSRRLVAHASTWSGASKTLRHLLLAPNLLAPPSFPPFPTVGAMRGALLRPFAAPRSLARALLIPRPNSPSLARTCSTLPLRV